MKPSLFRPVLLASAWLLASQAHGQNQIIREITPIPDPTTDPTGFFTRWMSAKTVTGTRAFIRTERTIDQTSFSTASFNSGRAYIILADGGVGDNEADTDDDGWSDESEIAYAVSLNRNGNAPVPTPIGTAYALDPYYFPPVNQYPMDVFNLFANSPAFDLSTYYNPDYIAATPGDYSIVGSARATRVSPFITDGKVRINAAPAGSLLPRPLALSVASKSIGYINSTTYSYDFLNFALYYASRSYTSASQMETEMLPGDYQVVYRLLSNTTLEAGGFVNHRLVPNGTLAIGQKKPTWLIRKATKQLDAASSPIDYTWSGGFLQIDPRLPLNLTWDSLVGLATINDKLDFKITDASGRVIWPSSVTQDISSSLAITSTQASFQIDPSYTNTAFGTPTSTSQPTGYLQLEYTRPLGASSAGDNSTVTLRVPVRFIRTYDSWKRYYFTGDKLANATISGPSADPDGDLLTNQQEFDAGTSPLVGIFPPNPPQISDLILSDLTYDSVSISANVTEDGVSGDGRVSFIDRGVLVSKTNSNPRVNDSPSITTKLSVPGTEGVFAPPATVSNLEPATIYFARAYATNTDGTSYTSVVAFYTPPGPPRIINPSLSIARLPNGDFSATMGGNVVDDGGDDLSTFRGVVYALTSAVSAEALDLLSGTVVYDAIQAGTAVVATSGTGSFSITIARSFSNPPAPQNDPDDPNAGTVALQAGQEYVFKAFAINNSGISYSSEVIFAMPVSVPVLVSPSTSSSITSTGATLRGQVANNGGNVIERRGFIYSTDPTKLVFPLKTGVIDTDPANNGATPLSYTKTISGLTPGTTYFFRAYAKNAVGYGYSQASSFTTASPIPLPGETSVQWVPLPSSEPVARMPLPGTQAASLPLVPMFVYEKHPDSMDDFIQYEVQISTDASDWQTAESAGWLVTGADDPSSPEITATWTSTAPMPEKAFFRVKALPASADLEF